MSSSAGYSGTPLAKKLGIVEGSVVYLVDAPDGYSDWIAPIPPGVSFVSRPDRTVKVAHVFATERSHLLASLVELRKKLAPDAAVWASWPKKSSKVPTDITEDTIREVALPLGFVDIKVCAVTEIWSGLKVVVRKELR